MRRTGCEKCDAKFKWNYRRTYINTKLHGGARCQDCPACGHPNITPPDLSGHGR